MWILLNKHENIYKRMSFSKQKLQIYKTKYNIQNDNTQISKILTSVGTDTERAIAYFDLSPPWHYESYLFVLWIVSIFELLHCVRIARVGRTVSQNISTFIFPGAIHCHARSVHEERTGLYTGIFHYRPVYVQWSTGLEGPDLEGQRHNRCM